MKTDKQIKKDLDDNWTDDEVAAYLINAYEHNRIFEALERQSDDENFKLSINIAQDIYNRLIGN